MSHFARVNTDGIVEQVIVIGNNVLGEPFITYPDTEAKGQSFIADDLGLSGEWRQTSYNGSFRKRYAGIGYYFDNERDEFVPPGYELVDGEWVEPTEPEPAN